MKPHPNTFYSATANTRESFPSLQGDQEAEVCVIGGGNAGLATALGLAERGVKDVVLLEANRVGWGASGRNGGFVFGGFSLGCRQLIARLGGEKAKSFYQLTLDAVEVIRRRIMDYNIDCDPVYQGVLLANWFDDDKALFKEQAFMAEKMGVEWEFIPREILREQLRTDRYYGGLLEKNAFHFHPLNFAQGMADAAVANGVRVFDHTRVTRMDYDGAIKRVFTEQGSVKAKHLVIACGGYIDKLDRQLSRAVLPVGTYVMATEPLGERLDDAITMPYAVYDTRFAFDYYRPLIDTRILWGGRISTLRDPADIGELLIKDLLKVYPQLEGVKADHAWSGLMSYATHQMPQIGQVAPNVWYSMGFGGHGVGPTTMAGELVASAIAKGDERVLEFEIFGLNPVYGFLGQLAAQATYKYYELRDFLRQ